MKKNILLISFVFFTTITNAQLIKTLSKVHPIKTADWGGMATSYAEGYTVMVKTELTKKFTTKLVDSIINNCEPFHYPEKWKSTSEELLKIYKVGEFDNNFRGKFHGVQYILWVPYSENKILWEDDYHLTPYDFFVFLPKEAVTLKN